MRRSLRAAGTAVAMCFRADRWRAWGVFVLYAVGSASGVLVAYWLKLLVDAAGRADTSAALAAALGIGVTTGAGMLASSSATHMLFPLMEHTGRYVDHRLVELTTGIPGLEHHERADYQDQIEVLRTERKTFAGAGNSAAGALSVLVQAAGTAALLASVNPLLLGVAVCALPSVWAGSRAEQIRQAALSESAEDHRRARHLFELATSPAPGKELRVFGLGREVLGRHRAAWGSMDATLDRAARRGLLYTAGGWLVFAVGYAAAILLVVRGAVTGSATVGEVVLALTLVAQVNRQVSQAVGTVSGMMQLVEVAGRYLWLVEFAHAAAPLTGTEPGAEPGPAPERIAGGIELAGVGFRYPGTDITVLQGVDLFLPAGTTVALVGDNGAGKSTLVKLLARFYDPTEGVISVDGVDLRHIDPPAWRARMAAGFQDFARFELLARETVGVGDLPFIADEAAVRRALDRAASAGVTAVLPHGLETQLGRSFDDGTDLSGGEWQKLALARAMMRLRPLLLILDEPTAALDARTEHALFDRYAGAARAVAAQTGGISVLVSHRFSTVRMADLIVVVDAGGIAEVGSHAELVARGGLYAELFDLQARSYR